MSLSEKRNIDLGNDKISKIFWSYAIPSIFAMLAQSTAGLVDSVFIGRYIGADGLSAITLIMPIIMLLGGIGTMIGIGGTTLAGIHKGKGNLEKSNNYFNITMVLLSGVAIIATIILFTMSGKISSLLGAKGKVAECMISYTEIISLFFIAFLLTFAGSFFLKLDGKPVEVVMIILSGTGINILLDYLFVGVLGWNMKGAALATGISQLIPWMLMLYIIKFKSTWMFSIPNFKLKEIGEMLFNGSSELLSMAAASIAGFIYNIIIIEKIGMDGVAAYAVALQITTISTSVFYGFAEAIQAAVSFNLGGNKLHRVKKLRNISIYANLISGVMLCVVSLMFGESIASIFIKEQITIDMAAYILDFYAVAFLLSGVNITLATYYTAVNSPLLSGILSMSRSLIGLMIGLVILPFIFGKQGIWMAVIFAEITTVVVGMICMRRYPFGKLNKSHILSINHRQSRRRNCI